MTELGIYSSFADNLRRECFRYPSIAAVCSGAGINRQQFNKYLAGKSLPSGNTLGRICNFLQISEESLFLSSKFPVPNPAEPIVPVSGKWRDAPLFSLASSIDSVMHGSIRAGATAIRTGLYYCYFPLEGSSHHLMRSLVVTRQVSVGLVFSRLTVFPSQDDSVRFVAKSKHEGFVLANERETFFLGINRAHADQMSLISFDRASGQTRDLLVGLSIIRTS